MSVHLPLSPSFFLLANHRMRRFYREPSEESIKQLADEYVEYHRSMSWQRILFHPELTLKAFYPIERHEVVVKDKVECINQELRIQVDVVDGVRQFFANDGCHDSGV